MADAGKISSARSTSGSRPGSSQLGFIHEINLLSMLQISQEYNKKNKNSNCWDVNLVKVILEKSGLDDVQPNKRIVNCVGKRLTLLLKKCKKARGGAQLKQYKETLSRETYSLLVHTSETCKLKLHQKNAELMAEAEVHRENIDKLERNLADAEARASYWKKRFQNIVKKVIRDNKKNKRKISSMSFADYSPRSQYRIKNVLKEECQQALSFFGLYDLIATRVEFIDPVTEETSELSLLEERDCSEREFTPQENSDAHDPRIDDVYLLLYVKERFNISDQAWHELSSISKELPTGYTLKQRISALNDIWEVKPTPGKADGVQISFRSSLIEQASRLLEKGVIKSGEPLRIKISGDGTRVGKRLQLVNVTYTILNEGLRAATEKGNYVIAIIKSKDDYETIRESLADLIDELKESQHSIEVGNNNFPIKLYLGGDWKFLATVCGLGPATHEYACIWCQCPKASRHDMTKTWPLLDLDKGGRTLASIEESLRKGKKYNCQRKPLFTFIELDSVVIDTLHLMLRVSDVLIGCLIWSLKCADSIEKVKSFNSSFNPQHCTHLRKYEDFLKSIGISFSFSVNPDTKKLQFRDLAGPEKIRLFQKIDFGTILSGESEAAPLQVLWDEFFSLYNLLRETYSSEAEIEVYRTKISLWIEHFVSLYPTKYVTPYMHAFAQHVPAFLKIHGNIGIFNQQGLEKYNDEVSKGYFRSSNHRGADALRQLILKKQRIHYLQVRDAERLKSQYKCRNCLQQGHSIKTCTNVCQTCQVETCCSHLVKDDGRWKTSCSLALIND